MDITKAIQILESLASGCSPESGKMLDEESVLNERNVIRAIQIAIDQLRKAETANNNILIQDSEIKIVLDLFASQEKNPTASSLTGFFHGSRHFKNQNLTSHELYGKYKSTFSNGQLLDFFSQYLTERRLQGDEKFTVPEFRKIDFFAKAQFNRLTENAINQLKEKINEIGVLKTTDLADYVQEARKKHPRAYEHWSEKEIKLLEKAIQYTNDLNLLSECFQRGRSSIESVGQKLILAAKKVSEIH